MVASYARNPTLKVVAGGAAEVDWTSSGARHSVVIYRNGARRYGARSLRLEPLEARLPLATFFVAPTGSDLNPGTVAAPWQTLQKAANSVHAGDTRSETLHRRDGRR